MGSFAIFNCRGGYTGLRHQNLAREFACHLQVTELAMLIGMKKLGNQFIAHSDSQKEIEEF